MRDRFVLVVNPRAGSGRAGKQLAKVERALTRLGCRFETRPTQGPGHATQLTRDALDEGAAGIAVMGGDGTLNEVANGFLDDAGAARFDPERWLGPLPCGTGGDFRRTMSVGDDVDEMARRLVLAEPRRIDLGWVTLSDATGKPISRAFLNIGSVGISGLVTQIVNAGSKRLGGPVTFAIGSLRARAKYRSVRVKIRVDRGAPREAKILTLAVANGRYFGGGIMVAPEAELDDGLLDIVSLERGGLVGQLALTPHLYDGTVLMRRGVWFARARHIEIEPLDERDALVELDGECLGKLPATFEVRSRVLSLR